MRLIRISLLILFSVYYADVNAVDRCDINNPKLKALYFTPNTPKDSFWDMQIRFAQSVARSINIELEVVNIGDSQHNRFAYIDLVSSKIESDKRPDIILGIFYLNGEKAFLNFIEQQQLPFFSVNSSLNQSVLRKIGKPRDKYKYWLGHISPNDKLGGFQLAKTLTQNSPLKTTMLAIAGQNQATVSFNREKGLLKAQAKLNFELFPLIHTDWSKNQAKHATHKILSRFKDINTIWTVGSGSAMGVMEYFNENPSYKGKVRVGAFDWTPELLAHIQRGDIHTSYGGHFKEAGWALLLAADYFSGFDFKEDAGLYIQTPLEEANINNAGKIHEEISQDWRNVNFNQYLKCRNPKLTKYPFI